MSIESTFPYTDPENGDMTAEIVSRDGDRIEAAWMNPNADYGPRCGRMLMRLDAATKTLHFEEFTLNTSQQRVGTMTRFVRWGSDNLLGDEVEKLSVYTHVEVIAAALAEAGWERGRGASRATWTLRG